jgi:hypothetical protein
METGNFLCSGCVQFKRAIDSSVRCFAQDVKRREEVMASFLLWCLLFVFCWPLALLALIAYPFVWLLLLPFRIVGIAVHGTLELVWALVTLPARLLSAPFRVKSA